MARLSLSIFVLCLFLALMVSAMPVKRENSSGNELDGTLAEQVAEQSLEVISSPSLLNYTLYLIQTLT